MTVTVTVLVQAQTLFEVVRIAMLVVVADVDMVVVEGAEPPEILKIESTLLFGAAAVK